MSKSVNKIIDLSKKVFEILSLIALSGMTIVILLEILLRNVFDISLSWGGELAVYVNFWLIFLGTAVVFKEDGHVRMDFLINKASIKIQRIIEFFNSLIILAFILLFLYSSILLMGQLRDVVTPALGMPYFLFLLPAILGFSLMILILIAQFPVILRKEVGENK